MQSATELCQSIAYRAHQGQVDKAGKPYINHPKYVAEHCQTQEGKCTAWLHDVLEDSALTEDDLLKYGLDRKIVDAVVILTRKENQSYFTYIKQIRDNSIASEVKTQDWKHNMQLGRLKEIKLKDLIRWLKYRIALSVLE